MVIDDVLREAVMQRLDVSDMEKLAEQQGMVTMLEDGMQKAAQGLTTAGEVRRVLYGEA
jgi:type II secretory ATPase GspE/PulE/Tfp pilus assembly ATPase PilB-like protein